MENIALGFLALALILYRQLKTRKVKEESSLRLILILGGIGLLECVGAAKKYPPTAAVVALMLGGVAVGAAFGIWRGAVVSLWRDTDGTAWRRGNWLSVMLWIPSIAGHVGIDFLVQRTPHMQALSSASILIYLGISLGVQNETVRLRASRLTHSPVHLMMGQLHRPDESVT